jgi:hypothetical protein
MYYARRNEIDVQHLGFPALQADQAGAFTLPWARRRPHPGAQADGRGALYAWNHIIRAERAVDLLLGEPAEPLNQTRAQVHDCKTF